MNDSLFICRLGEGAVQEGMGHVPDEDGGGREGILQDDGHHPSKLHACLAASFLCFPSHPLTFVMVGELMILAVLDYRELEMVGACSCL